MLHKLLTNRKAVNILKLLSEQDDVFELTELKLSESYAELLLNYNLIQLEKGERTLMSISLKGKQFIKLMDEMKKLVEKGSTGSRLKLSFNLSKEERTTLLLISKLGFDVEISILLKTLKRENLVKTGFGLTKILKALQEINLVELKNKRVEITELGKKTIINELLEEFNLKGV